MKTDDKYIKFDDVSKAIAGFIDYNDEQLTGLSESEAEKYLYANDQLTDLYDYIDEMLEKAETTDVQPVVRGQWDICSNGYYPYCSICRCEPENGKMTKYCPNCGARMDGNKEDKTMNERKVIIGGVYRHFKGGKAHVLNIAKHSETGKRLVIYECTGCKGTGHEDGIYARPMEMFLSEIDRAKYPDVKQKYRFELIEE